MRLTKRVADLEARMPDGQMGWLHVIQGMGQSEDEAIAAYEAANGPVGDSNVILSVITDSPSAMPERATGLR